jgi:Fe-S cluster assembly iron-binding protein IscA
MVDDLTENECTFQKDGAEIIVDETTLEFINGSTIDFKSEMIK